MEYGYYVKFCMHLLNEKVHKKKNLANGRILIMKTILYKALTANSDIALDI